MPYCEKCGKQLSVSSRFCSGCGTPQNNSSPEPHISDNQSFPFVSSGRTYLENNDNIIFRTGYSNKLFTKWIILICVNIFSTLFAYFIIQDTISYIEDLCDEYHITRYTEKYEMLETFTEFLKFLIVFFIVCDIIFTFTAVINLLRIKSNYLVITNDGIYGVACPSFGYGTLDFNIRFEQITSVIVKKKYLVFTTNFDDKKYHCFVEDYITARHILKKILISE